MNGFDTFIRQSGKCISCHLRSCRPGNAPRSIGVSTKLLGYERFFAADEVDRDLMIEIGDFGHGSDQPIILDCQRIGNSPTFSVLQARSCGRAPRAGGSPGITTGSRSHGRSMSSHDCSASSGEESAQFHLPGLSNLGPDDDTLNPAGWASWSICR
jgi:hypothetical protein